MAVINVEDAYILDETGAEVDKVTGLFTKDENTTAAEKAFAQLNIGGGGGGRNLLDNPFFTVRQRGDGPFNGAGFTVDRWSISGASSTLTATSGYISLNMAANAVFNQRVAVELELGKPYTASLMERDGTVHSATFTPTASENIFASGPYICVFDARATYAPNYRFYIYKETAWTADLKAVKLELGTVSTLANDAPPNYAEELAKCRYYFIRLYGHMTVCGAGYAGNATTAYILLPHAQLRTNPTLSVSGVGAYRLKGAANSLAVTGVTFGSTGESGTAVAVTVSGGLTTNEAYIFTGTSAASYIDLSADL